MSAPRSRRRASRAFDALRLETFAHLFAAVAEEMGAALRRSAFSTNVKERRDYSCALFDRAGELVAQAAHLPVHLGSLPLSVRATLERFAGRLEPGDAVLLNDPFAGGTHLPDMTLVAPVFLTQGAPPEFFVAARAHHADVGGPHPGSMGPARDVHGEGLRVPPVRLVHAGRIAEDVLALFLANVRAPEEREGDLLAQWSAVRLGVRRLGELAAEFGAAELAARAADQMTWTERALRAALAAWPCGRYEAVAPLDGPSPEGEPAPVLRGMLDVEPGGLLVDLTRSDDQVPGPWNAPRAVTLSALLYVLRLLMPSGSPTNAGLLAPVRLVTRPGSIVDAAYPAAVAAGNVETSQRTVDLLLALLGAAAPGGLPADSAGTMSNLSFGIEAPGGARTYYETLAGGAGAGPSAPGAHALQTHMTNTRNTPIEAFERELPVRVLRLARRRGSGGVGARRGGDGVIKELCFLAPARVSFLATRQSSRPDGRAGGEPGAAGSLTVESAEGEREIAGRGDVALELAAGARIVVETPGGGGHGTAASA